MIRIEKTWTGGFEGALRGMRNPYESHEKSDSFNAMGQDTVTSAVEQFCSICHIEDCYHCQAYCIGKADMTLAKKLIKAGPEHRKFLRMIHVQTDVIAPRYWWAEMDKYKWVEANSSSTMHLITKRELTIEDFSVDTSGLAFISQIVEVINGAIRRYNEAEDKAQKEWEFRAIKQFLPESYKQLRTIDTNYEALLSIHHQRHNHRLTEWRGFCTWIESLPYMEEFLEVMK